jgi:hypothetical protein
MENIKKENMKLVIDNDGYYYNGPKLELDPQLFYFRIFGDHEAPRLSLTIDYPEDIKKFFDKSAGYNPLIYSSDAFRNSIIEYFISYGISEDIAKQFDYSEHGLQYHDYDSQTIDFDIEDDLRDELENLDFIDCDYNEEYEEDEDDYEDEDEDEVEESK